MTEKKKVYPDVEVKMEKFNELLEDLKAKMEKSIHVKGAAMQSRKVTMTLTRVLKAYRDYTLGKAEEWNVEGIE